jgi:hypothetical protein
MKRLLQLLIISLFFSCVRQEESKDFSPSLIAHAGGAVDSCIYTNSREAMERSLAKGYRFIEFDLLFTSDSVLVAAHSWERFNSMTGYEDWGDSVPAYSDFVSRKICGRYTPLSAREINSFFEQNDSLYLVTDKVSDPEVLQEHFPSLKHRMVVEAFSFQHYCRLKSQGYFRVLYSCMAHDLNVTIFSSSIREVEWFALHTSGFDSHLFKFVNELCDFDIALFTVDDIDAVPVEFQKSVKMVYTNFIEP